MKPIDPRNAGQEPDGAGAKPDSLQLGARARQRTTQQRGRKNGVQLQPAETAQESSAPEPEQDDAKEGGTFRIYAAFTYALIFVVESIDLWLT